MIMEKKALLFRLVVLVAAMMCALGASAQEAYACYSPMTKTLTFYYDDYRSSLSGTTYDLNTGNNDPGWYTDGTRTNVTRVVFAPAFSGARPTTTRLWFSGMRNLQSITGLNYLNTSEVTNMEFMFSYCTGLTTLDLSSFNTSQVTDVSFMFSGSSSLRTIYVSSSWTTAAMTTSYGMFNDCTSLLGGQGTTWNSSNPMDKTYAHIDGGTNYPGYFTRDPNEPEAYACYTPSNTTLTFYYDRLRLGRTGTTYQLNYGNYQPDWVINSSYANVTRVVFDSSFTDARPTTTYSWFGQMSNLVTIEGMEYLNTSEVTNMTNMFYQCSSLTSLDLSSFNTSRVTSMAFMFQGCSNLQTIYAGDGWSTTAVRDDIWMFKDCTCLMGGMGTTYDANHTDKVYARIDGGPSNPGYFTATGTPVSYAYACYTPSNTTLTFYYDNQRFSRTGMTYTLNVGENDPGWVKDSINANVTKVVFTSSFADALPTTTYRWFYKMSDLQSIEGINNLNTSEVTDMTYMFYQCRSLTSLDLSSFNTSRVTSMSFMFYGCSNLQTIYAGDGWSTTAVRDDIWMFKGCTSLVGGQGTTYDDNHTDKDYAHIDGGPSNPGYFTDIQDIIGRIFEVDGIYYKIEAYDVLVTHDGTGQYGCYSGTVEIPEEVYYEPDGRWYTVGGIDERAFYRCPYLQHLILPNSIGIIHNEAFEDAFWDASNSTITCMALTPPLISPSAPDPYNAPEMTLYVPYGTSSAYHAINAWNQFGNIVELNYSFKKNGFYYKITGADKVSVTYKDGNYNTYSGRIVIPRTVTYYGVTYTVTAIDHLAFFNCPNLTDVVIPETVTAIGNTSFKNCTSLTGITIPNSVTSMGMYAFQNCTSLTDVVIGSGMTSIGAMAFNGCEDLDRGTITCLALVPPTINSQDAFDGGHYDYTVLYVPQSACADYQQAQYWGNFYDIRGIWSLDDALNDDGGSIHFESTGDYPWQVASGGSARHYAESGNAGVASTTSTLTATVDVPESGETLSFVFKAWGEGNEDDRIYDACTFYIDGSARLEYGEYQNDWESYSVDLEAGTHILEWSYSKDGSADPDGDYFAIDDVKLTPKQTVTLDDALNDDGGSIHFESTGDYPWKVVIDGGGAFSYAESGNAGVASTTSSLTATVDVAEGGATLSFVFQAWGEGYEDDRIYDACTFYIDGRARLEYGEYQNDWESYSVDLEAGTHTLKWSYSKDGSVDPEGDYFAIDHVKLTPKQSVKRGDVNGDSSVNISDVTALIDYLLTSNASGVNLTAADCNQDGSINISDVTALIDYMLTGSW
jgi:surface protein